MRRWRHRCASGKDGASGCRGSAKSRPAGCEGRNCGGVCGAAEDGAGEDSAGVCGFRKARQRYFTVVEEEVVKLALAIAARVLHREAKIDPMLLTCGGAGCAGRGGRRIAAWCCVSRQRMRRCGGRSLRVGDRAQVQLVADRADACRRVCAGDECWQGGAGSERCSWKRLRRDFSISCSGGLHDRSRRYVWS